MSNRKLWTTKDGNKIRICDLETSHLTNIIRLLERKWTTIQHECPFPNFSGEYAQMCAESDYDALLDSGPEYEFPIYSDLVEELDKRKEKKDGNKSNNTRRIESSLQANV